VIERVRSRLRVRGEAGYSLIEMLVVMVIMSIVFAGVTTVFVAGSKAQAEQDRRFQAQLATRLALDKIRRDIHCASDVTPFATNAATLKITGCSGGDVSWCTVAVAGFQSRYALYRKPGTSCDSAGTKIADYLTSASVFPPRADGTAAFAHAVGCSCLASLQVDFVVSLKGSTVGAYELTDTIFLRNSTRL
jgi:prepilin-type N-terminal cleavage/methylation domain-containing protein